MKEHIFLRMKPSERAMNRRTLLPLSLTCLLLVAVGESHAQINNRQFTQQSGGFGQQGFGQFGGGFGQGGLGQFGGGFGQGAGFNQFGGQGGFGGQGFGQQGFGGQGFGGNGGLRNQNVTGLRNNQQERFRNDGFVGRDAKDVRRTLDQQNRQPDARAIAREIEDLNDLRRQRRRERRRRGEQPDPIRVKLIPEFDYQLPSAAETEQAVNATLSRAAAVRSLPETQAELVDGVVTLRGTVRTERDRLLAERLASIEPGVSRVENLLEVQSEASDGPRLSAP